jgi:hypothetical protein
VLKVVTLLSTLRDPTQVRQRRCATRQHPTEFFSFCLETRGFHAYFMLLTTPYVMFEWKKTQILIAHQKERIDRTKQVRLAAKKSSARD